VTGLAVVGSAEASDPGGAGPGPVVGRLVRRPLQRAGETGVAADADLESRVVDLMTREERARPDSRGLVVDAATVFRRALSRPEVNGLLQGDCLFEVPFSRLYLDAARALFPETSVDGTVVYLCAAGEAGTHQSLLTLVSFRPSIAVQRLTRCRSTRLSTLL